MKEGKFYRFNEQFRDAFIESNGNNDNMLNILSENGGVFEVLYVAQEGSNRYVSKIRTANGGVFGCEETGPDYFELSDDEFCYFTEVSSVGDGVQAMTLIITPDNAEAMIELIKNAFNK